MKHLRKLTIGLISVAAVFAVMGSTMAATSFVNQGTVEFDSIKVGKQGSGGVTFFNGTVINNTTGVSSSDNPVTIGDNLRVDGRIYRGATPGTSDTQPVIINDNAQVEGTLSVGGNSVKGEKRYEGTIDTDADGDFIATYTTTADCSAPGYGATIKYYDYHSKKISVAEASLAMPPTLHLLVKPASNASYTPTAHPENDNVWGSAGYDLGDGAIYHNYKLVTETCGGTLATTKFTNGEYVIIVN